MDYKEWKQRVTALAQKLDGDGCSDSPDFFYRICCDAHDIAYRTGKDEFGDTITRSEADKRLFRCMKKEGVTPVLGKFILPVVYYGVVRIFAKKAWKGN